MLKAVILQAVAAAKAAVEDLAMDAQLVHKGAAVHTPGQAPAYPSSATSDIRIVLVSYTEKEVDGARVMVGDKAGLIFPEDGDPIPEPNDVVQTSTLGNFRVIKNDRVMAGDVVAMSQVQLRTA